MNLKEIKDRKILNIFVSNNCNLQCDYCAQRETLNKEQTYNAFEDKAFLERVMALPPAYITLSGGEPIIQQGLENFLTQCELCGHVVSMDTNLTLPMQKLKNMLHSLKNPSDLFAYLHISHHIREVPSLEYIKKRVACLKRYNIPHVIKYIARPTDFHIIEEYMHTLSSNGHGVILSILQTFNRKLNGRILPDEYTLKEIEWLLEHMTMYSHAIQIFNGIVPQGCMCRAGASYITYNLLGSKKFAPCCHAHDVYIDSEHWDEQLLNMDYTQCKSKNFCCGAPMFWFGIQEGIFDELEHLQSLLSGKNIYINRTSLKEYIANIRKKYSLANEKLYLQVKDKLGI